MQRLDGAIRDLREEFARSVQCHGMWEQYGVEEAHKAVSGEYREYVLAYLQDDLHGDHGMLAELLQCACVFLKMYIVLGGCDDSE